MLRQMLSGKIHRATLTQTELDYVGSITIDKDLLDAAGMLPGELVHVTNLMNGSRITTYTFAGEAGSGVVCLNGSAARCGEVADKIIVMSFVMCDDDEARKLQPKVIVVDDDNRIT